MLELEFITIAVTDYVTTGEKQVFPAEVSLVRTTLGSGVNPKMYHCIMNRKYRLWYGKLNIAV